MKHFLFCVLAIAAQAVFAQSGAALNEGTAFVHSIAPTSNGQVANPAAVNSSAWSGGTTTPTSVPPGLGGFSTPKTDPSIYNSAKAGGLTSLGNQAQISCQGFTPGSDPLRNQECAAVNFLSNKCITPSTGQASILGSLGSSQTALSAGCEGTYGQGAQQFNFKDQITDKDSLFTSMVHLKANAAAATGQVCTEQTVITEPAKYELNTCVKTAMTDAVSCSQYLNMSVTTTQTAATVTNSCNDGTLVGAFCQKSSTGAATPVYACPAGYTLSGTTCSQTLSAAATPNYSCPAGQTLSGSNCIDSYNVSTPATVASYTCPSGATLSGSQCLTTTTTAATVASYSCPAGQTLSGSICVQTTSTTNPAPVDYSCPSGTTLSGSNCVSTSIAAATPNYVCSVGVLNGANCSATQYIYTAATYICPTSYAAHYSGQNTYCVSSAYLARSTDPNVYLGNDQENNLIFNGGLPNEYVYMYLYPIPTFDKNVYYDVGAPIEYWGSYWGPARVGTLASKSCPSGQTLSGTTCTAVITTTTTATISSYSCPSGGTVSGSSCITTSTTTATVSYSCPAGQTLSGSNCTQTITTTSAATPGYACPAGYTLSGTTCSQTLSAAATPNYSCPAGQTLSGSNCIDSRNVSTAATVASYTCPAGATLSGSQCLTTTTTAATVSSYTCPAGATLSGTNCITVVTTPAIINYSCSDGSAPVAGVCFFRSANTSWTNTCGALEASAGVSLGTPK